MRKLLMATMLAAALASPTYAAEPMKLTDTQMDQVSAGNGLLYFWYGFLLQHWYGYDD